MRVAKLVTEIQCNAHAGYFAPDLSDDVLAELEENGPIECEGRGFAEWCQSCRFCTWFETNIEEG